MTVVNAGGHKLQLTNYPIIDTFCAFWFSFFINASYSVSLLLFFLAAAGFLSSGKEGGYLEGLSAGAYLLAPVFGIAFVFILHHMTYPVHAYSGPRADTSFSRLLLPVVFMSIPFVYEVTSRILTEARD